MRSLRLLITGFIVLAALQVGYSGEAGAVGADPPGSTEGIGQHGYSGHKESPINWFSFDYGRPDAKWQNPPLFFTILNFTIFALVIWLLVRKPLREYLLRRYSEFRRDLEEAARAKERADDKLARAKEKMRRLEEEIMAIKSGMQAVAEKERDRMIEAAEAQAEVLVAETKRTIEAMLERAKRQVELVALKSAFREAHTIISKQVSESDARRICDSYLHDVATSLDVRGM